VSPLELFEEIRVKALTMLKTSFMESERNWPGDDSPEVTGLLMPVLGIGIAATVEHFAAHPEHISLASSPICTTCKEPIQTLQVGVDPAFAALEEPGTVVKVAWPCGHRQ